MLLASLVLPLEGSTPSAVMILYFTDAVILAYGKVCDGWFVMDKGNCRQYKFSQYPLFRRLMNGAEFRMIEVRDLLVFDRS